MVAGSTPASGKRSGDGGARHAGNRGGAATRPGQPADDQEQQRQDEPGGDAGPEDARHRVKVDGAPPTHDLRIAVLQSLADAGLRTSPPASIGITWVCSALRRVGNRAGAPASAVSCE